MDQGKCCLALFDEGFRFIVKQKPSKQGSPARSKHATGLANVVLDIGRQHVSENREHRYEVKGAIRERKLKLRRENGSARVVMLVINVGMMKPERRVVLRDRLRTPFNSILDDFQAVVRSLRGKIVREVETLAADSRTHVEDFFARLQAGKIHVK